MANYHVLGMSGDKLLRGDPPLFGGDEASESDSDWLSEPESSSASPFHARQQQEELERGGRAGQQRDTRFITQIKAVMERGEGSRRSDHQLGEYRVYRWRWFMLATLCLLNLSNGMVYYNVPKFIT